MLRNWVLIFAVLQALASYSQVQLEVDPFAAAFFAQGITQEDLREHVTTLSSPQFEGRETGTPGNEKAAQYLMDELIGIGVQRVPGMPSFFQDVRFTWLKWENVGLKVNGNEYKHMRDFLTVQDDNANLPNFQTDDILFLGYGIDDSTYTDYGRSQVNGKVIMIYKGEPLNKDSISYVTGSRSYSKWSSSISLKLEAAARHKARAVLIVDPELSKTISSNRNRVLGQSLYFDSPKAPTVPNHLYISVEVAKEIIGEKQEIFMKNLNTIRNTGLGRPQHLPADVLIQQHLTRNVVYSKNVLGFIPGIDSLLRDEVVVVSAHYDHLGKRGASIFPGADDNGSGTSAVLEVMESLLATKAEGVGPRRSVACIFFTGEEKGLLGSRYYSENPLIPLDQTVADVNVDMIGRVDKKHEENPHYIYVIGSDRLSTELHYINEEVNSSFTHLDLDYTYNERDDPNRIYYRSDHYNFAKHGIPSIFYFSGLHDDYHRPSDTAEKLYYDKYETVARLIFHNVLEIANRDKRLEVDVQDATTYDR